MRGRGRRGLAALLDAAGLSNRPRPGISASCSGPASMPAGASAIRCWAPACSCGETRSRPPASPRSSTRAQPRAPGDRGRGRRRGRGRDGDAPRSRSRTAGPRRRQPGLGIPASSGRSRRASRSASAGRLRLRLRQDGTATGSGRSIPPAPIRRAVRACVESGLAAKGGGHAMAAGVTLAALDLDRFREALSATSRPRWRRRASARRCRRRPRLGRRRAAGPGGRRGAGRPLRPGRAGAGLRAGPPPRRRRAGRRHRPRQGAAAGPGRRRGRRHRVPAAESPVGRLLLSHIGRDIHPPHLSRDRWRGADRVELRLCDVAGELTRFSQDAARIPVPWQRRIGDDCAAARERRSAPHGAPRRSRAPRQSFTRRERTKTLLSSSRSFSLSSGGGA